MPGNPHYADTWGNRIYTNWLQNFFGLYVRKRAATFHK